MHASLMILAYTTMLFIPCVVTLGRPNEDQDEDDR